jgi:hypothetical protein
MRPSTLRQLAAAVARPTAAVLAAALSLLCPSTSAAAEDTARPSLAGHTFVSTDLVPDAFVRSYVRNTLGYAQALDIQYPPLVVKGDTLLALDGSQVYAILGFEYQQAVRDWIAVRAGVGMRTRLGTQASSLVAEGVTVNGGLELGWLARLRQTRSTSLCGSLTFSNQVVTVIDIQQFTEDVVDGEPNPKLIDDVPTVRTSGGLRFAWAVSEPFGVTLLAEGSYGESARRHEPDSWEYVFGASADYDLRPKAKIPIGLAFAYRQDSQSLVVTEEAGDVYQTVVRIAYNGRPDFLIALDLTGVMNREVRDADPVKAGGAQISLRYYF